MCAAGVEPGRGEAADQGHHRRCRGQLQGGRHILSHKLQVSLSPSLSIRSFFSFLVLDLSLGPISVKIIWFVDFCIGKSSSF